jgi:hypothetical protein
MIPSSKGDLKWEMDYPKVFADVFEVVLDAVYSERLGNHPIKVAKFQRDNVFFNQYRREFSSIKRQTFFSLSFLTRKK